MGTIKCSRCSRKRTAKGACECGSNHVLISIWWRRRGEEKGKEWRIRRFADGYLLDYERAEALLGEIRMKIQGRKFDPMDYAEGSIRERQFAWKADRWIALRKKEMEKDIIRPSSYSNIEGHMRNHAIPYFEFLDVKEINKEDLANFRDSLEGIRNKTKKNIFRTLHAFFVWLHNDIGMTVPPFPLMEPEDDSEERQALDLEEQAAGLKMVPAGVERDMLEFGMETGIRPGELVALKIKDLNLKQKRAKIARTVSKYTYVLEGTKGRPGSKSRKKAEIPLSDRALIIAETHSKGRFPNEWLFICEATGDRYSVKAPNRLWRKYTGSDLTYYEASRHSFLTQLSDLGVDVLDLKDLARHSDVRTTQRYTHKRQEHLREKVNLRNLKPVEKAEDNKK